MSFPDQPPTYIVLLAIQGIPTSRGVNIKPKNTQQANVKAALNHWHDDCTKYLQGKSFTSLAELREAQNSKSAEEVTALRNKTKGSQGGKGMGKSQHRGAQGMAKAAASEAGRYPGVAAILNKEMSEEAQWIEFEKA